MSMTGAFQRRKAAQLLSEGVEALSAGDRARAESLLERCRELDPDARELYLPLARALRERGKMIEGARALDEAVRRFPDDPLIAFERACLHAETGQFETAERALRELAQRFPDSPRPRVELALTLRNTRRYGALQETLREALARHPKDPELLGLMAQARLAVGDSEAARAWWARTLEAASRAGDELPRELPGLRPTSMRERVRSEFGALLLGTGHDDGLHIPWYSTYLCSNFDVIATIARLRSFARHHGWSWTRVAAVDETAEVLAHLVASALGLPRGRSDESSPEDDALAVASILSPGWERGARGPWALDRARAGSLFAFAVLDYRRHSAPLPPLIGVAGGERVCLPWRRLGEARIGFQPSGLIAPLPDELDPRPPAEIASEYIDAIRDYEPGDAYRPALELSGPARVDLQPGLRARCRVAHLRRADVDPPARERRSPTLLEQLESRSVSALQGALHRLDALEHRELLAAIDATHLRVLEDRFRDTPDLRARVAAVLYRRAPARFGALLEGMIAAGDAVPPGERDNLLHLYGCNPWSPSPRAQLEAWLERGAASARSEIVQSKYGLYFLWSALPRARFAALLDRLLDDEPAIALGTLHWLHDHPAAGEFTALAAARLEHPNPDIVFESLQLLRVGGHALPLERLTPLLDPEAVGPRVASSAIELLELHPLARREAPLMRLLEGPRADVLWATTRALLRGPDGARAAPRVAAKLAALPVDSPRFVEILRALTSAPSYEHLAPALERLTDAARVKAFVSALQRALIDFDDPRLVAHLRAHPDCHSLNPPPGFARFLDRHGEPGRDRALVFAALGATDPRAGYEAMGVLARWGERALADQLTRALDYPPAHADPALEAMFCAYGSSEFDRLAPPLRARARVADPTLWTIFRELARARHEELSAWLGADPARRETARVFIEHQLRAELPGKFVLGAQSAHHEVFARLDPEGFSRMVERTLRGTPDRFALDVLEDLRTRDPEAARGHAERLQDCGHWGVRGCARRILETPDPSPA